MGLSRRGKQESIKKVDIKKELSYILLSAKKVSYQHLVIMDYHIRIINILRVL